MGLIETWGTVAQADLAATANTTLYTVPALTTAVLSVEVCNRSGATISVRLWIAIAGAGDNDKQYILYDFPVAALDTIRRKVCVGAGDLIRARASAINTSWTVAGVLLT